MINDFFEYLEASATPERYKIYEDALNILVSIDTNNYLTLIEGMFSSFHNNYAIANLLSVDEFLEVNLRRELGSKFAVYVDEDQEMSRHLPHLTVILKGLYEIENYQDPLELLLILEGTIDPEEALAELIISSSGDSRFMASELMELYEVSPSLLKRIHSLLVDKTTVSIDEIDTDGNRAAVKRFKRYYEIYPSIAISNMLQSGLKLTDRFDRYIDFLYNYLQNEKNNEEVIKTLVLCAVMANVPNESIPLFIGENLPSLFIESSRVYELGRALNKFKLVD